MTKAARGMPSSLEFRKHFIMAEGIINIVYSSFVEVVNSAIDSITELKRLKERE